MEDRAERAAIKADMIIREYARIAFSDITNASDFGGGSVFLKNSGDLSADVTAAIQEVGASESETGGSVKIKNYDKMKALEALARHLDLNLSVDKRQTTLAGKVKVVRTLDDMSDDELMAIAAGDEDES
jgi:hypothetical protein